MFAAAHSQAQTAAIPATMSRYGSHPPGLTPTGSPLAHREYQVSPRSPMYSLSGRISLLSACCSITCAVQPAIRLTEKTPVNRSVGIPR